MADGPVETADASRRGIDARPEERVGGEGSANAGHSQLPVEELQLAQEALVGVDVAARADHGQSLRQRHAALDHQERERARGGARHAHEAVDEHAACGGWQLASEAVSLLRCLDCSRR